jgi:hypothetical protein
VRWRAADALSRVGGPEVEGALVGGLADSAKEVRKQCATGLGALASKAALAPLSKLLDDPDEVVREAAVEAIGQIGGEEAVVALARRLDDPNDKVALAAQKAFVSALDGDAGVLLAETSALAEAGKEKLALDILRLAREAIDRQPSTFGAEATLRIDRAYLDALVAAGTDESRQAAIRLAGQIAEEAGASDPAILVEFRRRQGDLFLAAQDYENAVETFSRLADGGATAGDDTYSVLCSLSRAKLGLGRANGKAADVADAASRLRAEFPESVSPELREERALLLREVRETFVDIVSSYFADGIGARANASPKWQSFETFASTLPSIEALLESVRDSGDPSYVRDVSRALKAVAPDSPPLGETSTGADREKEIEALRKFWQRRLSPPRPDRR